MTILLRGLVIFLLVAVNALFVAAEYSLLSVRRTRLEQLSSEGDAGARRVQSLLADVGLLFSSIQLGITTASLLMGWLGEQIVSAAIQGVIEGRLEHFASLAVAHGVATGAAFLLVTTVLMVLGELVPKALAYDKAEKTALLTSSPIYLFMKAAAVPVRMLDGMARLVLRVIGYLPARGQGPGHTAEEVKLIVSSIRKRGLLGQEQEEMIRGVFDMQQVLVREIMVPWPRITRLPLSDDLTWLLDETIKDQHSRVPIYERSPDHIIGILYTKDLLRVARERLHAVAAPPFRLRPLLHEPTIVPESMPLSQMLSVAKRKHTQMALVVDEFGTFAGLVTIEDVLEQIVGEIQDEYDLEEKYIQKVSETVFLVDASLNLRDLADDYGIVLPRGAGYETLAGFALAELGLVPSGGESFVFEGRRYTVVEMDGRRIAKIRVEKLPSAAAASGAAAMLPREPGDA